MNSNTEKEANNPTFGKPVLGDVFSDAFLKTLNSVYNNFKLVKSESGVYVFGYNGKTYSKPVPKEGGDLAIAYPEQDIVIVDKACIKPLSKEYLVSNHSWKSDYENAEILLGFSAGCKVFADYVKAGY